MALVQQNFADLITITRASGGGRWNQFGNFEWLGNDVPRMTFDQSTLKAKGIIVEEARTNLLTQSSNYASASWSKGVATIVPGATLSPDGAMNGSKMVTSAGLGSQTVQSPVVSFTNAITQTAWVIVKKAELGFARIVYGSGNCNVDLTNGVVTSGAGSITPEGDGWWKVSVPYTPVTTGYTSLYVAGILNGAGTGTFTGDGVSGIYLWESQVEVGSFPTTPIPTTTVPVTRAADIMTLNSTSPWYNPDEGTLFLYATNRQPTPGGTFTLSLGSDSNNYMGLGYSVPAGAQGTSYMRKAGAGPAVLDTPSGRSKIALAWNADSCTLATDGAVRGAVANAGIPTVSNMYLGRGHFGGSATTCCIMSVRYYPRRLTDDELILLTT